MDAPFHYGSWSSEIQRSLCVYGNWKARWWNTIVYSLVFILVTEPKLDVGLHDVNMTCEHFIQASPKISAHPYVRYRCNSTRLYKACIEIPKLFLECWTFLPAPSSSRQQETRNYRFLRSATQCYRSSAIAQSGASWERLRSHLLSLEILAAGLVL